jgi:outer membrane protein OmpU
MKKNLLATSALVAAAALASQGAFAQAKPISITVGGYYQQWIGYAFQDSDDSGSRYKEDSFDVQEDGEIHFEGRTVLDNGLAFGLNVQLEAATSSDQIDESYLFVRGDFGEILLGSENGPAYAMHYGLDNDMGYDTEDGDHGFYWMVGGINAQLHSTRPVSTDNDSQKIRWISPRISGFQVGAAYSPEGRQDNDGPIPTEWKNDGIAGTAATEDIVSGGVNYDNMFGDVRVRLSGVIDWVGDDNGTNAHDNSVFHAATGLRLGFGGFDGVLAYSYAQGITLTASPLNVDDAHIFGAGLAYTTGPLGVSLIGTYALVNDVLGTTTDGGNPSARDASQLVLSLGMKYVLGPGVEARGNLAWGHSEDLIEDGTDYDGIAIVSGISLNF